VECGAEQVVGAETARGGTRGGNRKKSGGGHAPARVRAGARAVAARGALTAGARARVAETGKRHPGVVRVAEEAARLATEGRLGEAARLAVEGRPEEAARLAVEEDRPKEGARGAADKGEQERKRVRGERGRERGV
jgi:hypothetical protein